MVLFIFSLAININNSKVYNFSQFRVELSRSDEALIGMTEEIYGFQIMSYEKHLT